MKNSFITNSLIKNKILKKDGNHFILDEDELLRKESHHYMHYNGDSHITVRSKSLASTISLEKMIEFSMFFHRILKSILEIVTDENKTEFDKTIYDDGTKSFDLLTKNNKFLSLENTECKLCNKGMITRPKDKTFSYGPYLQCDNCDAILSVNTNLKLQTKKLCPKQECVGKGQSIRHTFSYRENKKYFECISCGYRFNSDNNEIEIDNLLDNNAYMYE